MHRRRFPTQSRFAFVALACGAALSGPPALAQSVPGVPCRAVSVLAVWATPASPLTVTVNGVNIGAYDDSIALDLEGFLKPGVNSVRFSYPSPARASTEAALKCQPPGADSKSTILLLKPSAAKLEAEAHVDFVKQ
jgi:hypothetical protein